MQRQGDLERRAALVAVNGYRAAMKVNDGLHISKSQSESFHVMHITCMNAIELVEDLLQVFSLYADAIVRHHKINLIAIIP